MNLKESYEFWKNEPVKPEGLVMSSEEPIPSNQVIQYQEWNFLAEEITREEFMQQHRENLKHSDAATGVVELAGSRPDYDTAEEALNPPEDHRFFYRLRRLSRI